MPDKFSKDIRSKIMKQITSKNTKPELKLRKTLWKLGYRYRIHYDIPGKPDIVFISANLAIFVDGCFWHRCPNCFIPPKSNQFYWNQKLNRNVQRDQETNEKLAKLGWNVLRVWEHDIKEKIEKIINQIEHLMKIETF